MVSLKDFLDPLSWTAANQQLQSDIPLGLMVMEEGMAAPISPWHAQHGDVFTSRERIYLDADDPTRGPLFGAGLNGPMEEAPLWAGEWIDAVSSWVVAYRWEDYYSGVGLEDELIYNIEEGQSIDTSQPKGSANGSLYIQFNSGAICRYDNMPPHMALGFHQAISKGRWIHSNLYKIWSYELVQGPHVGARKAVIDKSVNEGFIRQLTEQGLGGEQRNREITSRFRQPVNMPGFVEDLIGKGARIPELQPAMSIDDLLKPENLPNLADSLPELWTVP